MSYKDLVSKFIQEKNFFFFIALCLYPWFLISGPLLSDVIAIILSIYYLYSLILEKKFDELKQPTFIIFFLFCLYISFNSIFFTQNKVSIQSSLFFIRFGFFAFAVSFLLNKNKDYLKYFLFSFILAFLLLFIDSIFQKIFGYNIIGIEMYHSVRVSSFFRDELILGSYTFKILPVILAFLYFIYRENAKKYSIIFVIISLIIILLSSEKTSFVMIILFSLFFFLKINYNYKIKTFIFFSFFSVLASIMVFNEPIKKRILSEFITNSAGGKYIYSRPHDSHYRTAYKMFLDKPVFGHGPKMFRFKCSKDQYKIDKFSCSTHPHNFVLQILSETGIVGFIFFFSFIMSILIIFLKNLKKIINNNYNYFAEYILSICLLMVFFPLAPSGNLFNNWLSCSHFLILGVLLFFNKLNKNKNSNNKVIKLGKS